MNRDWQKQARARRNVQGWPRRRVFTWQHISSFVLLWLLSPALWAQSPARLAIVDLPGDEQGEIAKLLRMAAGSSPFELLDEDLTRAATRGAGYSGNLNFSRDEARAFGLSLGCDFYVLGKVLIARRAGTGEQFYFEALAGLFFVETRTGRLLLFDYQSAKAEQDANARQQLFELLREQWPRYTETLKQAQARHANEISNVGKQPTTVLDVFTDETTPTGTQQPVFYQRLKPEYTTIADLAGIAGTVEIEATFGADGQINEIEVIRWAGFGLDESAVTTIRQLRFKPAELDGKKLTIRGLVRYNFRRPAVPAAKPQAATPEEIERIRRSLRDINSPKRIPGQRP